MKTATITGDPILGDFKVHVIPHRGKYKAFPREGDPLEAFGWTAQEAADKLIRMMRRRKAESYIDHA